MEYNESAQNILQALFESSSVIQDYVQAVADGNALPFTVLIKDKEMEDNQVSVQFVKDLLEKEFGDVDPSGWQPEDCIRVCKELMDRFDIHIFDDDYEDGKWECCMMKDGNKIDGTTQIVTTRLKIDHLTDFAKFKGYTLYVKDVEDAKE